MPVNKGDEALVSVYKLQLVVNHYQLLCAMEKETTRLQENGLGCNAVIKPSFGRRKMIVPALLSSLITSVNWYSRLEIKTPKQALQPQILT